VDPIGLHPPLFELKKIYVRCKKSAILKEIMSSGDVVRN
jgi:hypothetical protein